MITFITYEFIIKTPQTIGGIDKTQGVSIYSNRS